MDSIKKYYSKKDNLFHVMINMDYQKIDKTFKSFKGFVKFLDGNITGANLYEYDFDGIDLRKYNIDNVGINGYVLKQQGLLDTSFYDQNISNNAEEFQVQNPFAIMETKPRKLVIKDYSYNYQENHHCVSYISDIHLNHKLKKKYPEYASKQEIIHYLHDIVENIRQDYINSLSNVLLIGGDVSYKFSIAELFYKELRSAFRNSTIIVILGNHELWDSGLVSEARKRELDPVEHITSEYRQLFDELGIVLLQNELLIGYYSEFSNDLDYTQLSESSLFFMSDKELKNKSTKSAFTVFGGIAFSGYETKYNANMGMYREAIKTLEEDERQTQKFEYLYHKIKRNLSDKQLIILSHTPKPNWSKDDYCKSWIYVNGHTHQNYYCISTEKTVFADNQIGYGNKSIRLKHFYVSRNYDLFRHLDDGIYEISREEYLDFYRGYNEMINYNRTNTKIHMLKHMEIYCFIQENIVNGTLSILSGGSPKRISGLHDLRYYYENLEYYSKSVENFMYDYNNKLRELSNSVKAFDGSGHIHGSIVDIDFFNHLYLNPFDGKVTPYFANSMTDKYVYQNIASLLFYKAKYLIPGYEKAMKNIEVKNQLALLSNNNLEISKKNQFVPETDMYRFSRVAKNLQFITKMKVVRTWNDELIMNKYTKDNQHLLFIDLIESK